MRGVPPSPCLNPATYTTSRHAANVARGFKGPGDDPNTSRNPAAEIGSAASQSSGSAVIPILSVSRIGRDGPGSNQAPAGSSWSLRAGPELFKRTEASC